MCRIHRLICSIGISTNIDKIEDFWPLISGFCRLIIHIPVNIYFFISTQVLFDRAGSEVYAKNIEFFRGPTVGAMRRNPFWPIFADHSKSFF